MPGIGIILNPHSSSNRRNPERIRRLAFIVGDKGSCHATQDVLDVPQIAREFQARGIDILGISGGDGTIHHTISTFIEVYGDRPVPMIALLRGGTMNNVANAVGVRGMPESILSNLIVKYHEGAAFRQTEVHTLCINGKHGFLFGNGLATRFIEEYIRCGEGGALKAGWLMARSILGCLLHHPFILRMARRFDAKVTVDGVEWPFKNYVVLDAGTVEPFGLGFKPFYRAREREGHFHMIGFSMTPRRIVATLFPIWLGRPTGSEHYLEDLAREVVIETPEPQAYMVDGEICPPTPRVTLTCGPRLHMIVA
ncbi:MAG: sphingosine kinase [Deltaproteobacteria bacterium]|nr:sphingosine kinase [Deltaproteobacteria bacterium]